jgi:hypothetical protein
MFVVLASLFDSHGSECIRQAARCTAVASFSTDPAFALTWREAQPDTIQRQRDCMTASGAERISALVIAYFGMD